MCAAVAGCNNPTAWNFNVNATEDDGSCRFHQSGCDDPEATNYNPTADFANRTLCIYPPPPPVWSKASRLGRCPPVAAL